MRIYEVLVERFAVPEVRLGSEEHVMGFSVCCRFGAGKTKTREEIERPGER